MAKVVMYTKNWCPFCVKAKILLNGKGHEVEEINVEKMDGGFEKLKAKTGMMTVPQIFVDDKLIGGFQELSKLETEGKLDEILK